MVSRAGWNDLAGRMKRSAILLFRGCRERFDFGLSLDKSNQFRVLSSRSAFSSWRLASFKVCCLLRSNGICMRVCSFCPRYL
uniref:Uncharacterized protein n=1 Tax=Trichuris muris TaxID=70415 RepID=A0A5S6QUF3_TRIMR